jgi:hypothetical protein
MLRAVVCCVLMLITHDTSTARSAPVDQITYTAVPPAQVALLDWALDLFADAGLALPPIDVVGHRTDQPCRGRTGMHRFEDGRSRIDLCTADAGPVEEFVVLHELAHAWDRNALTSARREAFLALRGLEVWRDDDPDRWHELGAEHAAEILVWGLMDRPVRIVRLEANSCADLLAGYRVLTGAEPLHGYTDACRTDDP